jgi:hypothetical protein
MLRQGTMQLLAVPPGERRKGLVAGLCQDEASLQALGRRVSLSPRWRGKGVQREQLWWEWVDFCFPQWRKAKL